MNISISVRFNVVALVTLLSFQSAQAVAASFDCRKAVTSIEMKICTDPALSVLDEQLATAYQQTLAAVSDKEAVRHQQREWLTKTRNACRDQACLKATYELRLAQLAPTKEKENTGKANAAVKYPPYPDVWHRQAPEPREIFPNALSYGKAADGDIVVLYARLPVKRPEDFDRSMGTIHFFSGDHSPEIDYEKYLKQTKPAYPRKEIPLEGGKTIKRESLDERIPLRCPQQLNSYFVITDANGQSVRKSLLYILDRPQRYPIEERCADTSEGSFDAKVVAIQSNLLPLDDGTFLVKDGVGGVVIRFDANLKTKSTLFGRQLFWVDPKEIERFHNDGVNYQHMHDAILALLHDKQETNK